MKSAAVLISKKSVVLYPEVRNKMGLRVPAPPLQIIDVGAVPEHLADFLMTVLNASSGSWSKDMPEPLDYRAEVLKAAGLRSWSDGAYCTVNLDTEKQTLRFAPTKPKRGGHLGVKQDVSMISTTAGNRAIGRAMVDAILKSKGYAGI